MTEPNHLEWRGAPLCLADADQHPTRDELDALRESSQPFFPRNPNLTPCRACCQVWKRLWWPDLYPTAREVRLLALLREVEWRGKELGDVTCPVCGNEKYEGHASDCSLAAELRAGPSPMAADRLPSGTEGEG